MMSSPMILRSFLGKRFSHSRTGSLPASVRKKMQATVAGALHHCIIFDTAGKKRLFFVAPRLG
jgi:hypothetical protein